LEFEGIKSAIYAKDVRDQLHNFSAIENPFVDVSKIRNRSKLHQRSYIDFKARIADHLLSDHGDRMVFANSGEGRYPFLDIDLVEFVTQVPQDFKLRGMEEKYALKEVARKYIPNQVIDREKFSFVAPGCQYLLQHNIEWVNDLLSYDTIKRGGYFDPDVVERLKKQYMTPGFKVNQTFEIDFLMIVLSFGIFKDQFGINNLN
jgi:asparagine synthase (glutamine-hydrolysing)